MLPTYILSHFLAKKKVIHVQIPVVYIPNILQELNQMND